MLTFVFLPVCFVPRIHAEILAQPHNDKTKELIRAFDFPETFTKDTFLLAESSNLFVFNIFLNTGLNTH